MDHPSSQVARCSVILPTWLSRELPSKMPSAPVEDPVDGLKMALSVILSVIFSETESKLAGLGSGGFMPKSLSAGARKIRGSLVIEAN